MKFSIITLFLMSSMVFGQTYNDSIILMNGKVFRGEVIGLSKVINENEPELFKFNMESKKERDSTKLDSKPEIDSVRLESYRVFSYTKGGVETVLYKHDSLSENFLTVNQSRNFTLGSYDARQKYSSRAVFFTAMGLSYGGSLFDSYLTKKAAEKSVFEGLNPGFFGRAPSLLPLAFPLVLSISFGLPSTKVRPKNILQSGLKGDPFYYAGFNEVAKQKRTFAALKGSAIGIGLGYLSYMAFKTN